MSAREPREWRLTAEQTSRIGREAIRLLLAPPQPDDEPREIEIAHAVALERERIAGWLASTYRHEVEFVDVIADDIRRGLHNPQTPTSGDSRGAGAPNEPESTPRPSTGTSGPDTTETGMDSCRPSPESEDA